MVLNVSGDERNTRMQVYESYRERFANAPIRLMSRTASKMRSLGFSDLATAIGDLDWKTVPANDPEDPTLREEWGELITGAFGNIAAWLPQLSAQPMGYNLDSVGYPSVTKAWANMWRFQTGIEFTNSGKTIPQVYFFHGGNQAVSVATLAVAEARRDRIGSSTTPTMLVPVPTFTCPLDQVALTGMNAYLLPPTSPGLDPSPDAIQQIPDGIDIDGVYLMPINNPTGRTTAPEQLAATLKAVLDRWPHAGIILDSVYVRMHPDQQSLLTWYDEDERFADAIVFVDSLSKTHGVTGLRCGALLTRSEKLATGINRYAQNVMAGPSNVVQAVAMALIAPYLSGDEELIKHRVGLQIRIGNHLRRRRRLLMVQITEKYRELLDDGQPALPDPERFDWDGSMYAVPRFSQKCLTEATEQGVSPTVAFYLATGVAGVPLDGFCRNPNLVRHGFLVNAEDDRLLEFQEEASKYVRLAFGMIPPPLG
jgi:aspartate/methionine/tyrosine aminotransferase